VYYTRKLSHFVQILSFVPKITDGRGCPRAPSELKMINFSDQLTANAVLAFLNSTLFYWTLSLYSDCRNLNKREILNAPMDLAKLGASRLRELGKLGSELMDDLKVNSKVLEMNYKAHETLRIQCTYPKLSKHIIDEIDCALASYYEFTPEELDFIINYDVKYRMGRDAAEEVEN
jgi:hypothetical protein